VSDLRQQALHLLAESCLSIKVAGVSLLHHDWHAGGVSLDASIALSADVSIPGRPVKPELISPLQVGKRSMQEENIKTKEERHQDRQKKAQISLKIKLLELEN
jgi:uncharacterized ferritin-like protein (DUF455 family)